MANRKIIKIDEDKCDGCGLCIPNCPEGALKVIDGKARLISDLFCDGLGACIGHCPRGAINIEERDTVPYDEKKVMENIVRQGENVIAEHLKHLKDHGETKYLEEAREYLKKAGHDMGVLEGRKGKPPFGCPGTKVVDMRNKAPLHIETSHDGIESQLRQWPVQIKLVPPHAPYLNGADLLIAADCVPFAYADFHAGLLKGKTLLVGCPKLDDIDLYREKIYLILKENDIRSVTYAHMEVPCCSGLIEVIKSAIETSGKNIPFKDVNIGINGERLS